MSTFEFMKTVVQFAVPPPCFDIFFVKYDLMNAECVKITISKLLGIAIILGSVLVKVPQIVKLMSAGSARGLSLLSVLLELTAVSSTVAYSFLHQFPFSSYGDAVFLVLQTWVIAVLVLHYGRRTSGALLFSAIYVALLAFLLSGQAPEQLIWWLYAANLPNVVIARLLQIVTNAREGSTGQLSAVTTLLVCAGATARIFTSLQETGDALMVAQYALSATLNGILVAQLGWYWNAEHPKHAKVE